jgi:hypothetical protein
MAVMNFPWLPSPAFEQLLCPHPWRPPWPNFLYQRPADGANLLGHQIETSRLARFIGSFLSQVKYFLLFIKLEKPGRQRGKNEWQISYKMISKLSFSKER